MDDEILWPPEEQIEDSVEEESKPDLNLESALVSQPNLQTTGSVNVPSVSLTDAVRNSSKSRGTLRRWIVEGKISGALKTENGWQIPISSLVSSGAWDSVTAPDESPEVEEVDRLSELEAELLRARFELNSEKKLREAAERNAEDLRSAMRMLTTGNVATPIQLEDSRPQRPASYQKPQDERWEFTPAAFIEVANKFRKKLLG